MLKTINLNGNQYFADINNKILYDDSLMKSGKPFSFLTRDELTALEKELRV
jgi:hypothetical protein